jgi:predicted nucleic acid-binding protein
MIIVSDTTPLRYLIEVEKAYIIESLFSRVIIPQAVFNDLQQPKTPQTVKEWIVNHPAWLEVRQADLSLYTPQKRIGAGEREAFALALELQADAVLLDDKGAIVEAKRLGLVTIRTFDILERAAKENLLDLPETIDRIKRTSFRLPPAKIIDEILKQNRRAPNQLHLRRRASW